MTGNTTPDPSFSLTQTISAVTLLAVAVLAPIAIVHAWPWIVIASLAALLGGGTFGVLGGFRRDFWIGTPEEDAAYSAADQHLDRIADEQRRANHHH